MKIQIEKRKYGNVINTYVLSSVLDRNSAMRWIISASKTLPFDRKSIRIEDGISFHDGTISFVCSEIDDIDSFINEYLNSEIYLITISGDLHGAYITVQAHLDLQKIFIGYNEGEEREVEKIEQLLGLV